MVRFTTTILSLLLAIAVLSPPDARAELRLAILAGDLNVDRPVAAGAVLSFPAKHVPQDELLPGLQLEHLPGPLALRVREEGKEVDRPLRGLGVEVEAT